MFKPGCPNDRFLIIQDNRRTVIRQWNGPADLHGPVTVPGKRSKQRSILTVKTRNIKNINRQHHDEEQCLEILENCSGFIS